MFDALLPGLNNLCIDFFSTKKPVTFIREGLDEFSLKGIFDNNYISVDPDSGASIISSQPVIGVREIDIPGGKTTEDDRIRVDGVVYRITDDQPDSAGMRKLYLQRKNL